VEQQGNVFDGWPWLPGGVALTTCESGSCRSAIVLGFRVNPKSFTVCESGRCRSAIVLGFRVNPKPFTVCESGSCCSAIVLGFRVNPKPFTVCESGSCRSTRLNNKRARLPLCRMSGLTTRVRACTAGRRSTSRTKACGSYLWSPTRVQISCSACRIGQFVQFVLVRRFCKV
jgi:hypothetical protein